jgi:ferric-dicitrate binding protein FerR (iron transport regulator)
MTTSDPLKEATQLLRDAVDDPGDVEGLPAGRDAAIAAIEGALRARGRSDRRRRVVRAPLLAAAVLLLVGGTAFALHRSHRDAANAQTATLDGRNTSNYGRLAVPNGNGGVTALRDGHSEAIGEGARLSEGTELQTRAAEASLDFDSGTHVTLGSASRVRLVEQTARKRFALEAGSLTAKVAKLSADERFVVSTPDAEVEVRGTAFRVTIVPGEPSCEGGTPTRLEVTEGVVVVTRNGAQVRVGAGEHWPACGTVTAAAAAVSVPVADLRAPPAVSFVPAPSTTKSSATAVTVANGSTSAGAARPEAGSRLAAQNDLFDEAIRLKRAGNTTAAITKLDRLLAEYPHGPLAETAAAERKRLLSSPP